MFCLDQMVCERSEVFASACAIARAFPLFTRRSTSSRRTEKKRVTVEFVTVGQDNGPLELSTLEVRLINTETNGIHLKKIAWKTHPTCLGK